MLDPVGPDEVAARLGVPANTVSQWRRRGQMPAPFTTVSRVPLWDWPLVHAWADTRGMLGSRRPGTKVQRDEVAAARAAVLAEIDRLADAAIGILESCGAPTTMRGPTNRAAERDMFGRYRSLDGRGNDAGEWDWYWQLDATTRAWLRTHFGPEPHRSSPDQVAPLMASYTGTPDVDACMAEWLRCVRIIDAASALHRRLTWRRCSHLFVGLALAYDPSRLFGTFADAADYLAELREEPSEAEDEYSLIARLGPSPLDMDFDEWSAELAELEAQATQFEQVAGEWDVLSADDQAVYSRLEELLPSAVAASGTATLEDLYVTTVGLYLAAVA